MNIPTRRCQRARIQNMSTGNATRFIYDPSNSFSRAPSACGIQCSTESILLDNSHEKVVSLLINYCTCSAEQIVRRWLFTYRRMHEKTYTIHCHRVRVTLAMGAPAMKSSEMSSAIIYYFRTILMTFKSCLTNTTTMILNVLNNLYK